MRENEKILEAQIENIHLEHCEMQTEESANRLQQHKDELEQLRRPQIEGLIVRSRTEWHEEGERSSKYFLGLEKRNALRKCVATLKIGDQILTRTSSILTAFTENLSTKYNKQNTMPTTVDLFINRNVTVTLNDQERDSLDLPLSYEELTEAAVRTKKGKSPGSNGYTATFFKFFWEKLGPFLFRAFNTCSYTKQLISSHKEGIITMIPKAGKPPDSIKAWCPITLLNTDFKIISAAIAARLKKVISKLTDQCQTAYVKGRYIGENTRLIYDVINYLTKKNGAGLIMSADFEAAFDSLSWEYISRVLKGYNFGPHFRELVSITYLSDQNFSRIILNGYLGNRVFLGCGIRQGDPASGYIFNLAVNLLANQIKQSQLLTGIHISALHEVRITQYADDTVLFLNDTPRSLRGALTELNTFSRFSGLNLNIEKTSCLPIAVDEQQYGADNFGVKWVHQLKVLGITFTNNNNRITETNIEPKITQIKKEIGQWRRRNLTPLGKITVIKSLLISKLVHLFTALPTPSEADLKQLERIFFSFLWGSQRDPIKRAKAIQKVSAGGLGMVDIHSFVRSLKLTWLKRCMMSNATWTKLVEIEVPKMDSILQFGSVKLQKIRTKISNPFWKDVLEAFSRFSIDYEPELPGVLTENLWFSDYSKFQCTIVRAWNKKGLRFLADLLDESSGQLMLRDALKTKFGISMTVLCYSSLIRSLPECVRNQPTTAVPKPILPLRMSLVMNQPKFSRFAYNTFVESRQIECIQSDARQKQKWIRDIGWYNKGSIYDVFQITRSTRIRMFHYKLINRIISTNTFLKIINIKDDDKCTFCKQEAETLVHMFWHCTHVQAFINQLTSGLRARFQTNLHRLDVKAWFFLTDLSGIEALIATLAKLVIYEARLGEKIPNATHFMNKLKCQAEVEKAAARMANRLDSFEKKWGALKSILE